ncbi:MAG TPA: C39 family peptidase [Thermodesulfobacteriota bacterium]|nr:C39 family peptidase [Thermodesulfobacteriota bacterium]
MIRLIASLAVLFSCAAPPPLSSPPSGHAIPGVPFFAQEAYQCGPASLAGVLNFWRVTVSPQEIAADIFSPGARGTLDMDMVFYARKKGLNAAAYRGRWEDLRANIDAGRPLVVLVDEGIWVYERSHFMVVTGYGEDTVTVNSGKIEHAVVPRARFLKTWERAKFWTLRITRDDL